MKEDKLFIPCDCGHSGLLIEEEIDFFGDKEERYHQEFNIALYTCGELPSRPSLWSRIKYAWHHLKTGKMYHDCVIMSEDNAKDLLKYLAIRLSVDHLKEKHKNKIKDAK